MVKTKQQRRRMASSAVRKLKKSAKRSGAIQKVKEIRPPAIVHKALIAQVSGSSGHPAALSGSGDGLRAGGGRGGGSGGRTNKPSLRAAAAEAEFLAASRTVDSLSRRALTNQRKFDARRQRADAAAAREDDGKTQGGSSRGKDGSLKAYYKEFKKVVDGADVVLEVLDARDPLGSRCPQVEQEVVGSGGRKRLVLVLNKIDLVPREVVERWLRYLRLEFPTVAFKASTQLQQSKLSQVRVKNNYAGISADLLAHSRRCVGADMLMKMIGNYSRAWASGGPAEGGPEVVPGGKAVKASLTVGVVGFPNVGKSSIINSLKRAKCCAVGAVPGVTRARQEVHLDKHLRLLDSPGIIMAHDTLDPAAAALRNCVRVEAVADPIRPVEAILRRCDKRLLAAHYHLEPDFSCVDSFLDLLARRLGRLKKGGLPDPEAAARLVLTHWNTGAIRYYTHPPETYTPSAHLDAKILPEFSKEFDVEALRAEEEEALKGLKPLARHAASVMRMDVAPPTDAACDVLTSDASDTASLGGDGAEPMDGDEAESTEGGVTVSFPASDKSDNSSGGNKQQKSARDSNDPLAALRVTSLRFEGGNKQLNKVVKRAFKRKQKKAKKTRQMANALAGSLDLVMNFEGLAPAGHGGLVGGVGGMGLGGTDGASGTGGLASLFGGKTEPGGFSGVNNALFGESGNVKKAATDIDDTKDGKTPSGEVAKGGGDVLDEDGDAIIK